MFGKDESVIHVTDVRVFDLTVVGKQQSLQVQVCPTMTVEILKQRIGFYTGIHPNMQSLTCGTLLMQSMYRLFEYGINNDSARVRLHASALGGDLAFMLNLDNPLDNHIVDVDQEDQQLLELMAEDEGTDGGRRRR